MKPIKVTLATTHKDRHGEQFSFESLKLMAEQTNENIVSIGYEHDPRIAPLGRIISAKLIPLEDGEYAVEGEGELFAGDFSGLSDTGDKEIIVRKYDPHKLKITADRNFRDENSVRHINELQEILGAETEEEIKKSLEPISILTIGGAFVLGGIANGFLGKIGSDVYDSFKVKLSDIFKDKTEESKETLFTFDTTVTFGGQSVNVEVIITNPTVEDIQQFFDEGIKQLDQILPRHFAGDMGLARIVLKYKAGTLAVKFAVLKNGTPVYPAKIKICDSQS